MRRQNEKHNLCVRLCFFDAKYEKKWDHTHARIAGANPLRRDKDANWQSTPTRELRASMLARLPLMLYCQSTPTRELRAARRGVQQATRVLAIHTHARIAGCSIAMSHSPLFAWQSTPTRELRGRQVNHQRVRPPWQSTPTRELRGQFVCNCKGCRGLRTCILFRIGFENGENTASPAIQRGNTLRRPFTDGGGTHCLRRAWSVWDMPCPSMVCEGKGK